MAAHPFKFYSTIGTQPVDIQLQRIDSIKYKLENRVNNLIRYMGKSAEGMGRELERLIRAIGDMPEDAHVMMPVIGGEPASAERLAKPRIMHEKTSARVLRKQEVDPRFARMVELAREARKRRHVTQDGLISYVERHMTDRDEISTDELTIASIEDYCALVMLSHISVNPPAFKGMWGRFTRTYQLERTEEITENEYLEMTKVLVKRARVSGSGHAERP